MRLILDLDGVVYRGEEALPDAGAFFALLHRRRIPYLLLTNNSTRSAEAVADKLRRMGIDVSPSAVLTSSQVTATYVARHYPGRPVYVVGEDGLREALAARGCRLIGDGEATANPSRSAVVVVGMDTSLTYHTLSCAAAFLQHGAPFIASNRDASFPAPGGRIAPGSGAIVAALEVTTGRKATVMGKPELPMFEEGLRQLDRIASPPAGAEARQETWVVGDRLDTDIAGARRAGLPAALVLTGVTTEREAAETDVPPDIVARSLADVALRLLGAELQGDVAQ